MAEKTEPPTRRRLQRAIEQGDLPVADALVGTAAIAGALLLTPAAVQASSLRVHDRLRQALSGSPLDWSAATVATDVVAIAAPIVAGAAALALAAGLLQTRGALTWPGAARRRSEPAAQGRDAVPWRAARSLVGIVAMVGVLVGVLRAHASSLAASAGRLEVSGELAGALCWRMALFGLAAFALLAAMDWVASRLIWLSGLRMTRHEVALERRETEGDPRFKQVRRRAHAELVQKAAVAELARAAVVVEGHGLAVALEYDGTKDLAPRVLSIARGDQARQTMSHAGMLGIFAQRNAALAQSLARIGQGAFIPERLYDEVAELLAAVPPSQAHES